MTSARTQIETPLGERAIYRLDSLGSLDTLPYSIKVLLESCLRNHDGHVVTDEHVAALANYDATAVPETEIPFVPGRVVLQDFTGVPAVVDLAAMRSAMQRMGGDPNRVNPLVPCDLVIDHSVQVDAFNSGMALAINSEKEFQRNRERYEFLKWGQSAFDNFRVVPPATGIVHQVNLEYLGKVVWDHDGVLYPDSLVGTDSHTTMINGLGILGWGVGGIEAEAVMLGQPVYMLIPEVDRLPTHREARRTAPPPPTWCCASRRCCASTAWSGSSSSSSARVSKRCRSPTAPPSPTWRPSTAPPAATSRSTSAPSTTCARPVATRALIGTWSSSTPRTQGLWRDDRDPADHLHRNARARPGYGRSRRWPAPSGHRTAST